MSDQWLTARDVAALLRVSERTFYRILFFRTRKHFVTDTAVRYAASDVALYQYTRKAA